MIDIDTFVSSLNLCFARDTSSVSDRWSEENSALGHCAIAAVCVQERFGGTIVRGDLRDSSEFNWLDSHYWNILPDGQEIDATASQFEGRRPHFEQQTLRTKKEILSHLDTLKRYRLLSQRIGVIS